MSGDNAGSDSQTRSRSLFRQVRDKIGGVSGSRRRTERSVESASIKINNTERISADSIDAKNFQIKPALENNASGTLSHHLSLLRHVKFHFNKNRKSAAIPSAYDHGNRKHGPSLPAIYVNVSYSQLS